ncbi:SWIM-type domain-containing protein [Gammaproteobacteria bacterium]
MKNNNSTLAFLLTIEAMLHLAGQKYFTRGQGYFSGGNVRSIIVDEESITAKVFGSREYRIQLTAKNGKLDYSCTCPIGNDGDFCKHCVAVGLEWLNSQIENKNFPSKGKVNAKATTQDVRIYLSTLDKAELVEMLMSQAKENELFYNRLLLRAEKNRENFLNLNIWRQAIDKSVYLSDFLDYCENDDYIKKIDNVIDSINDLLNDGHARETIELTEYALLAVEKAIERIDDSEGGMGFLLNRLQEIHLHACEQAQPNPEELAKRLFDGEMASNYDVFYRAIDNYAHVLGEIGISIYHQLAKAEWGRVPALIPGQGRGNSQYSGNRFKITSIMETIAKKSGDIEQMVDILRRDLSNQYQFLKIAEFYQQAGKRDAALNWAEQGWKSFSGARRDTRLREFLVNAYHDLKRHDEAMALAWESFSEQINIESYQKLRQHANRANQGDFWRKKALSLVRNRIQSGINGKQTNIYSVQKFSDHSVLVEIFLWEDEIDQAWKEAQAGGCSQGLWLNLAVRREKNHPEDSLKIYKDQIESNINLTHDQAYQTAITLLRKVEKLQSIVGRSEEFRNQIEALRIKFKRKRNFIKLLDKESWS